MAGTDELMARLQQLENGYYGDKEAARRKQFFDTYGSRWSNNEGLGMAVLNELDRQGIDTSAADEAVQSILDQLRTECTEILDLLKDVQEAAGANQEKIETVADAFEKQIADNPDASVEAEPNLEVTSPEEVPALEQQAEQQQAADMFNFEGGEPPAEPPVEPPAEPPAEEVPPAEPPVEPPAEEVPPEPPAEEVPPTTVSDVRMKRIERMKARWSKPKSATVVSDQNLKNVFKPSTGMLEAAMRGF